MAREIYGDLTEGSESTLADDRVNFNVPLDMTMNQVKNMMDPTELQDAVTLGYLQSYGGSSGIIGGDDKQILFNNSGTIDGATGFIYDRTNNRVGLGTLTPATNFDINGNYSHNIVTATTNIDCSKGNYFSTTVAGTVTFTITNPPSSRFYICVVKIIYNSGSITWPASVLWDQNVVPTLETGKKHLIVLTTDDAGTNWRGNALANYTS